MCICGEEWNAGACDGCHVLGSWMYKWVWYPYPDAGNWAQARGKSSMYFNHWAMAPAPTIIPIDGQEAEAQKSDTGMELISERDKVQY